jgi:hypothetical protein
VPGAGAALCRHLEAHETLSDLFLSCNRFPAMDAPDDAPVLAAGAVMRLLCHAGAALRKLALCCSHFGDDGMRGVARALAHPGCTPLTHLDVTFNSLSNDFLLDELLPAVTACASMRVLVVDEHELEDSEEAEAAITQFNAARAQP